MAIDWDDIQRQGGYTDEQMKQIKARYSTLMAFREKYPLSFRREMMLNLGAGHPALQANASASNSKSTSAPQSFEAAVRMYLNQGETRAAAVRYAAQNFEDLHREFLDRLEAGQKIRLFPEVQA